MPHIRQLALVLLLSLVPALLMAGCSSAPEANTAGAEVRSVESQAPAGTVALDPPRNLPNDFTIDVTILPGAQVKDRPEAHFARSKYILFPDGSLHGDRGRSMAVLTRPARIRTLSRETMADLWLLLRQSGYAMEVPSEGSTEATSDAPTPFQGNPALLAPSPGEVLTILTVHHNNRIDTYLARQSPPVGDATASSAAATDTPSAMTRVVRRIARLAWATDDPPIETYVQPIRYDLGDDPYARYRQAPAKRSTQ